MNIESDLEQKTKNITHDFNWLKKGLFIYVFEFKLNPMLSSVIANKYIVTINEVKSYNVP